MLTTAVKGRAAFLCVGGTPGNLEKLSSAQIEMLEPGLTASQPLCHV